MHISLTDKLDAWVREKVASGLYGDASEVIREALRHRIAAEQTEAARLAALRAEIDKGLQQLDRGEFADFDLDRLNRELDAELDA